MYNLVDEYWNNHTITAQFFSTKEEFEQFVQWRFSKYPLFKEYMGLYGNHKDEIVLDYGCGPGTDVIGFAQTGVERIFAMDISSKAIEYLNHYIAFYPSIKDKIQTIMTSDDYAFIPLVSESIDYINCGGVLHHISHPGIILKEFYRILSNKESSKVMIYVYNYDSIFLHLYVAFCLQLYQRKFHNMSTIEAFSKSTDGENCPISRCYKSSEFTKLCEDAGFTVEYIGGYLSDYDHIEFLNQYKLVAIDDDELADEHKNFLKSIEIHDGFPYYDGKTCGIGGVYRLTK